MCSAEVSSISNKIPRHFRTFLSSLSAVSNSIVVQSCSYICTPITKQSLSIHSSSCDSYLQPFHPLLGPVTSTWLARNFQQTSTWSKLSPTVYRHLTPAVIMLNWHKHLYISGECGVWCTPFATTYTWSQNNFMAIIVRVTVFCRRTVHIRMSYTFCVEWLEQDVSWKQR